MARRILAAACLAVVTLAGGLIPGMIPPVAASSCSSWTSETAPPPTIRVFRTASATGAVDTVDFKTYAKNVLSREWIGSWTIESLRSGALAVRNYAWYQVLHWRGGVNADGACFDLRDDTWDQVYDPSKATWSTAAAAVDATWSWLVTKAGHIFPTYYNAGTPGEACGANANGWKAYQWGTQACGLAGKTASQIILTYYYPGVTISGAPAASPSPTPTATPTPAPTATAAPTPTPASSGSPASSPSPTATPAPTPTPRPTATPAPTPPPADQQLPGGGQATVTHASAPPPPPPAHPKPVVAKPAVAKPASTPVPVSVVTSRDYDHVAGTGRLEEADAWGNGIFLTHLPGPQVVYGVVITGGDLKALTAAISASPDPRLAAFRTLVPQVGAALLRAIVSELAARQTFATLLLR